MDQEHPGNRAQADQKLSAPSRPRSFTGGLGVILSVIAFCMSGYLWYVLARRDQIIGSHVVPRIAQLETITTNLSEHSSQEQRQLQVIGKAQGTLQGAFARLGNNIGQRRRQWAIVEAEQLLVIANHRLQLDHEFGLALAALKAADRELYRADDPHLLPVRHRIADEIVALESLHKMDLSGLALRLQGMAEEVNKIPLGPETVYHRTETPHKPETPPAKDWQRFLFELQTDFSNLIRIQRDGNPRPPLLPQKQAYFVRQNLKLMLYSAQLALLEHEDTVYSGDLERARSWLARYFDPTSPSVQHMERDLLTMRDQSGHLRVPDISASLESLRQIVAKQGQP